MGSSHVGGIMLVVITEWLWGMYSSGSRGLQVSICLSETSSPKQLARSIGSEGSSPKLLAKSNQTCFCTRTQGGHSANGLRREWGCPVMCIGAPSICILPLDSCCWGWRWRLLKEQGLGMVRGICWVCWGKSQNVALVAGDSDSPVESAPTPRRGMSSPRFGLPWKRFLPQPPWLPQLLWAYLKETKIMMISCHGSVFCLRKWVYLALIWPGGQLQAYIGSALDVALPCTPPATHGGVCWGLACTPPVHLFCHTQNLLVSRP